MHACETGISELRTGGDEMFGLVRPLLFAGATTLILSRWEAFEPPAKLLAKEFYSNLLNGQSAGIALRNARRVVYNKPTLRSGWGTFFLQGDPFRKLQI